MFSGNFANAAAPPPARSAASSVNVSAATSLGDYKKSKLDNNSMGSNSAVSSPSIRADSPDGLTKDLHALPPMDDLPADNNPTAPSATTKKHHFGLPLAPVAKANPFTATASVSFGFSSKGTATSSTTTVSSVSKLSFDNIKPSSAAAAGPKTLDVVATKPTTHFGPARPAATAPSFAPFFSKSAMPSGGKTQGAGGSDDPAARTSIGGNHISNEQTDPAAGGTMTPPLLSTSPISKSTPETTSSISASPAVANQEDKAPTTTSADAAPKELFPEEETGASDSTTATPLAADAAASQDEAPKACTETATLGAPSTAILPNERLDGWDEARITRMKTASAFNKAKLHQLDEICAIQSAADSLVAQDTGIALQRDTMEAWFGKLAEIQILLDGAENDLKKIASENPVLNRQEVVGESAELQDLWLEKQSEFVDLFVSHRDRYIALLRASKLVLIADSSAGIHEHHRNNLK